MRRSTNVPTFWLTGGRTYRVGKHSECEIQIKDDKSISRLHLTIGVGLGPLQEVVEENQHESEEEDEEEEDEEEEEHRNTHSAPRENLPGEEGRAMTAHLDARGVAGVTTTTTTTAAAAAAAAVAGNCHPHYSSSYAPAESFTQDIEYEQQQQQQQQQRKQPQTFLRGRCREQEKGEEEEDKARRRRGGVESIFIVSNPPPIYPDGHVYASSSCSCSCCCSCCCCCSSSSSCATTTTTTSAAAAAAAAAASSGEMVSPPCVVHELDVSGTSSLASSSSSLLSSVIAPVSLLDTSTYGTRVQSVRICWTDQPAGAGRRSASEGNADSTHIPPDHPPPPSGEKEEEEEKVRRGHHRSEPAIPVISLSRHGVLPDWPPFCTPPWTAPHQYNDEGGKCKKAFHHPDTATATNPRVGSTGAGTRNAGAMCKGGTENTALAGSPAGEAFLTHQPLRLVRGEPYPLPLPPSNAARATRKTTNTSSSLETATAFQIHLGHHGAALLLVWVELTAVVADVFTDHAQALSHQLQRCGVRWIPQRVARPLDIMMGMKKRKKQRIRTTGEGERGDTSCIATEHCGSGGLSAPEAEDVRHNRTARRVISHHAQDNDNNDEDTDEEEEDGTNSRCFPPFPCSRATGLRFLPVGRRRQSPRPCGEEPGPSAVHARKRGGGGRFSRTPTAVPWFWDYQLLDYAHLYVTDHLPASAATFRLLSRGLAIYTAGDTVTVSPHKVVLVVSPEYFIRLADERQPRRGAVTLNSSPTTALLLPPPPPPADTNLATTTTTNTTTTTERTTTTSHPNTLPVPPSPLEALPGAADPSWSLLLESSSFFSSLSQPPSPTLSVRDVLQRLCLFGTRSNPPQDAVSPVPVTSTTSVQPTLSGFTFVVLQPRLWREVQAYVPAAGGQVVWDPFLLRLQYLVKRWRSRRAGRDRRRSRGSPFPLDASEGNRNDKEEEEEGEEEAAAAAPAAAPAAVAVAGAAGTLFSRWICACFSRWSRQFLQRYAVPSSSSCITSSSSSSSLCPPGVVGILPHPITGSTACQHRRTVAISVREREEQQEEEEEEEEEPYFTLHNNTPAQLQNNTGRDEVGDGDSLRRRDPPPGPGGVATWIIRHAYQASNGHLLSPCPVTTRPTRGTATPQTTKDDDHHHPTVVERRSLDGDQGGTASSTTTATTAGAATGAAAAGPSLRAAKQFTATAFTVLLYNEDDDDWKWGETDLVRWMRTRITRRRRRRKGLAKHNMDKRGGRGGVCDDGDDDDDDSPEEEHRGKEPTPHHPNQSTAARHPRRRNVSSRGGCSTVFSASAVPSALSLSVSWSAPRHRWRPSDGDDSTEEEETEEEEEEEASSVTTTGPFHDPFTDSTLHSSGGGEKGFLHLFLHAFCQQLRKPPPPPPETSSSSSSPSRCPPPSSTLPPPHLFQWLPPAAPPLCCSLFPVVEYGEMVKSVIRQRPLLEVLSDHRAPSPHQQQEQQEEEEDHHHQHQHQHMRYHRPARRGGSGSWWLAPYCLSSTVSRPHTADGLKGPGEPTDEADAMRKDLDDERENECPEGQGQHPQDRGGGEGRRRRGQRSSSSPSSPPPPTSRRSTAAPLFPPPPLFGPTKRTNDDDDDHHHHEETEKKEEEEEGGGWIRVRRDQRRRRPPASPSSGPTSKDNNGLLLAPPLHSLSAYPCFAGYQFADQTTPHHQNEGEKEKKKTNENDGDHGDALSHQTTAHPPRVLMFPRTKVFKKQPLVVCSTTGTTTTTTTTTTPKTHQNRGDRRHSTAAPPAYPSRQLVVAPTTRTTSSISARLLQQWNNGGLEAVEGGGQRPVYERRKSPDPFSLDDEDNDGVDVFRTAWNHTNPLLPHHPHHCEYHSAMALIYPEREDRDVEDGELVGGMPTVAVAAAQTSKRGTRAQEIRPRHTHETDEGRAHSLFANPFTSPFPSSAARGGLPSRLSSTSPPTDHLPYNLNNPFDIAAAVSRDGGRAQHAIYPQRKAATKRQNTTTTTTNNNNKRRRQERAEGTDRREEEEEKPEEEGVDAATRGRGRGRGRGDGGSLHHQEENKEVLGGPLVRGQIRIRQTRRGRHIPLPYSDQGNDDNNSSSDVDSLLCFDEGVVGGEDQQIVNTTINHRQKGDKNNKNQRNTAAAKRAGFPSRARARARAGEELESTTKPSHPVFAFDLLQQPPSLTLVTPGLVADRPRDPAPQSPHHHPNTFTTTTTITAAGSSVTVTSDHHHHNDTTTTNLSTILPPQSRLVGTTHTIPPAVHQQHRPHVDPMSVFDIRNIF